ncbi:MAG TPA: copper-binding protein [Blastocatellia bacterium]|nr:copper-binding protein [Blastocatellia bacterium]
MRLNRSNAKRFAGGLILMSLVIAGLISCRGSEPLQRYELKGKVISVDKRGSTVAIAHQAIPGYMEAMTMTFTIDDARLLDELAAGDGIQATLVVGGKRARLENVIHTRETVDPSNIGKSQGAIEPKPGDEIPDFSFVNQDGKRISFRKYRGRAVVVTFIYTRCPLPDYCPLMTENFAAIQNALTSEPNLHVKSNLVSITVDPEYDTPGVLRGYATAHSADTSHWDFGTGTKAEVKKIATWFGLQYFPDNDQIVHSLRTAIIDPEGKLAKLYRGNEWQPEEIVAELRYLATPDPSASNPNIHRGVGVIQSIDLENASVQIDHEEIKDFMPAMDMPYPVKDKALLESLVPGDKVDFWIEDAPAGSVIIRFHKR